MFADFKKLVLLQKQAITTLLLFCTLFFTTFSSDLLATSNAYDKSQTKIKHNLRLFLEKFYAFDAPFIRKFTEKKELCYELSALWLYSKWLDNQHNIDNEYGRFHNTVKTIVQWDGEEKLSDEEFSSFENFIRLIALLEVRGIEQLLSDKFMLLSKLKTGNKRLKQKYTIASGFTLAKLRYFLNNIVYNDELICIDFKGVEGLHMVGLYKHGEHYYYYNSDDPYGEIRVNSVDKIAQIVFAENNFYSKHKNSIIGFSIYSFNENSHIYPDPKEILTGIDPSFYNDGLIMSAFVGNKNTLAFFLEKGADPNQADNYGWTALMFASRQGHVEIVDMLFEKGADPNLVNKKDWTALMFASLYGRVEVIEKLLNKGADRDKVNNNGQTAFTLTENVDRNILDEDKQRCGLFPFEEDCPHCSTIMTQ